jgi:uncharacterized membrane protein YdjX (TVP38/TMEM64 family)
MGQGTLSFLLLLGILSLGFVSCFKSPLDQHATLVDVKTPLSTPNSFSYETERMLQLHGGDSKDQVESSRNLKVGIAVLVPTLFLLWTYREKWIGFFNKEQLQAKTLEILEELNAMPKAYSYSAYVSGMAFWELIGASTIPVETAAGMVFGWKGFLLSSSGKLLGAIIAFVIGRYGILANWIQDKLSTNWFLQLVRASTDENPLLVAFLLKCSSFPETVKNYGSAILSPIKLWMFVVATTIHGFTFSALWTYLGVDAAARLENADLPADRRLEFLLGAALVNGIVVSPLVMAYWIKSLKAHQASLKAHQAKKKNNNEVVQKVRTWASDYKVVPKLRALVRNFVGYIWESIEQETKDRVRRKISSNDNLPQRMREKVN